MNIISLKPIVVVLYGNLIIISSVIPNICIVPNTKCLNCYLELIRIY